MAATILPVPVLAGGMAMVPHSHPASTFGLIHPPQDIRNIIDKTAEYVAKNGPEFEARLRDDQNKQKFSFLMPTNPYRPYYEAKIKEFQGGGAVKKPEVPKAILDMRKKEEEKQRKKDELKMLTMGEQPQVELREPDPDLYSVPTPFITPLDVDIIKTTAQFVARNGQKFLIGLTHKEARNAQFDFLKPTHALFQYFTQLVEAYTKCLMPPKAQLDRLTLWSTKQQKSLERIHARSAWEIMKDKEKKSKEQEEEDSRMQMQTIDWHEFIVVETIEFTAQDDNLPLAPPLDAQTLATKYPLSLELAAQPEPMMAHAPMESVRMAAPIATQIMAPPPRPPTPPPPPPEVIDIDEEIQIVEPERPKRPPPPPADHNMPPAGVDSEIKIRRDYVRKPRTYETRKGMVKCPLTGLLIPEGEMTKHLKVSLLDPKWKQQKDAMLAKAQKESAFAPQDDIEGNLASFVTNRPDLFGTVEDQILEVSEPAPQSAPIARPPMMMPQFPMGMMPPMGYPSLPSGPPPGVWMPGGMMPSQIMPPGGLMPPPPPPDAQPTKKAKTG
eukprot:Platyproteum_vivax@DN6860_c0_g1_i2.p1